MRRTRRGRKLGKSKVSSTVKKYVNKQIHKNIENKIWQLEQDSLLIPYTAGGFATTGYDMLAGLSRGTTESVGLTTGSVRQDMLALQIRARSFRIKGNFYAEAQNNIVRMLIVLDNQASNNTNLSLYSSSLPFDNLILQTEQICSPLNQYKRFKVLKDKIYRISQNATGAWIPFSHSVNLKNMVFKFFPTNASFFELNKRIRVYFIGINDSWTSASNPTVQYTSTFTYEDA